MKEDFFTPKFSGARFTDSTVPADVLPDIAALQEMLVELAKDAYMREHPERSRAPRNFDTNVQVHLAAIEEGSAKIKLVLFFAAGLFTPYQAAFQSAQAVVTEAVAAASQGQSPALSPRFLSYFERVGRGLRQGESLDFPTGEGYAMLNQETRHNLIQASQAAEWTDRASLRVRVSMTNYRTEKYEVQLGDGTAVSGDLHPTITEQLKKAHGAYGTGKDEWLLLQCVVRKDRSDKIKAIESVEHAALLDPLDVAVRLQELSMLKDGWLDGEGHTLPQDGLNWLTNSFAAQFDSELQLPRIYPTPEANVLAEWLFGRKDVSLEINLVSKQGEYSVLDLDTGESEDDTLELGNEEGWKRLNERLSAVKPTEDMIA